MCGKKERGGGREVGMKAGMQEMGNHFACEDGTDERRKGGMDGMEGEGARE